MQLVAAVDQNTKPTIENKWKNQTVGQRLSLPSAAKAARWTKLPSAQRSSRPSRPKTRRSPTSRPRKRRAEAEIARIRKEKEDAVAVEAVSFRRRARQRRARSQPMPKDAVIETFKANPENARKIFGSVPERTKLSSLAGTQGGDASSMPRSH